MENVLLVICELSLNSLKSQDKEGELNAFNIIQRRNRNAQYIFGHKEREKENLPNVCELIN